MAEPAGAAELEMEKLSELEEEGATDSTGEKLMILIAELEGPLKRGSGVAEEDATEEGTASVRVVVGSI